MSKAFDSIIRSTLMEELEKIVGNSELRIIRYLLAETSLKARINGSLGEAFQTTIGTPRGDALSPALFIIYLELALRKIRLERHNPDKEVIPVSREKIGAQIAVNSDPEVQELLLARKKIRMMIYNRRMKDRTMLSLKELLQK
jgi:retron-type reverse transcriptase